MKIEKGETTMIHEIPQPGQELHREKLGVQPHVELTPTQDEFSPLEESLPTHVTRQEVATKNREFWEPSWGSQASRKEES